MTEQEEILSILNKIGAVLANGHFVLNSDKHSAVYVEKEKVILHTKEISKLCRVIAERFANDYVETVIGPGTNGGILSQWIAYHLTEFTRHETLSTYADKTEKKDFIIRYNFAKNIPDKRILVVDDVISTGGSAKKVIEAVRAIRGNVVGLGALVNRGNVTPKDVGDVPKLISLVNIKLDIYEEGNCPLCSRNIPINTKVGHGKEYLDGKGGVKNRFVSG